MQVRRYTVVTLATLGALGGAVALAAPDALAGGNQASSAPRTHPAVRPRIGRRHTTFELTFTLAVAPGPAGLVDTYYHEAVSPPAHAAASCSPTQPAPVLSGSQGATIKVALHPPGHGWCRGRYDATVFLQRAQRCGPPLAGAALIICPVTAHIEPAFPDLNTGQAHFTVR
jgi:hypothetical protein